MSYDHPSPDDAPQADDERTFEDALLHLKKAITAFDLIAEGKLNMFERQKLLNMAHDRTVRAYNTVAYLNELPSS